jgi:hypothetical protein
LTGRLAGPGKRGVAKARVEHGNEEILAAGVVDFSVQQAFSI